MTRKEERDIRKNTVANIAPLVRQIQIAREFINKIAYDEIPSGTGQGETVTRCKECGQTGWLPQDIKHKRTCEVGSVITAIA